MGVGLSLHTGIPLVYSQGRGEAAVFDLIGAYDIGHPALLITDVLDEPDTLDDLIQKARRVGLEVNTVLAVIDTGRATLSGENLDIIALAQLREIVESLLEQGELPAGQGDAALKWIETGRM
jgi:orotate phosphoribosyltransferase